MPEQMTDKLKAEISELFEKVKQDRDELNLQMHLAKAEAKEEWELLEKKWNHFQGRAAVVGEAAHEASDEVGAATRLLAQELKQGYQHIRAAIVRDS